MRQLRVRLSVLILFGCLAGCGSKLRVSSIQLGRSLNQDHTVANHTTRFGPHDTVYLSILTTGSGRGTVGVRWTYAGRVMGEPTKDIKGTGATEFHLQNAGGFPPGDYTVDAFLDGQPVGSRAFKVEEPR